MRPGGIGRPGREPPASDVPRPGRGYQVARQSGVGEPEVVYRGQFLEFVRQPFGAGHWEYIRRAGQCGVVFIYAVTPDDQVVLIRQFRPPLGAEAWELPAGVRDRGGEAAQECALRELIEETGYRASSMEFLTRGPVAAGSSATVGEILLAGGLEYVGPDGGDELFPIHVSLVARRELVDWVRERVANDELVDPRILAAHCLAETRLGMGED